jgi:hypothetical protein
MAAALLFAIMIAKVIDAMSDLYGGGFVGRLGDRVVFGFFFNHISGNVDAKLD